MAGSLNKVHLIGRLGQEPDFRNTSTGREVTKLRLATTDYWTDNKSGEKREKTVWHSIVCWANQARFAKRFLGKGDLVYVEGSISSRQYEDQNGVTRRVYEITARNIQILQSMRPAGRPQSDNGPAPQDDPEQGGADDATEEDIPF